MRSFYSVSAKLGILLSIVGLSSTALAEQVSKSVAYGDLNLSSDAGRAAMQRRIDGAVRAVCGRPGTVTLVERMQVAKCAKEARANSTVAMAAAVDKANMRQRMAANTAPVMVGN